METQIIKQDGEFCSCEKELIIKIVPYEEREETTETVHCELCGKPEPDPLQATFNFNNNIEFKVLEPKTNFTREEFQAWQSEHVMSGHISYEEYLIEQRSEL